MLPDNLRVVGNGSVPSFVNNGEMVVALPEGDDQAPRSGQVAGGDEGAMLYAQVGPSTILRAPLRRHWNREAR